MSKITGLSFTTVESYISAPDWMLVKLHGSVDWGYSWTTTEKTSTPSEAADKLQPPSLKREQIETGLPHELVHKGTVHYPAITLPVAGKYGFVFPPLHVEQLQRFVADCRCFLFIGCSGNDADLFEFLDKTVDHPFLVSVLTGKKDHDAVLERFRVRLPKFYNSPLGFSASREGFTKFLERQIDEFLNTAAQYRL